AGLYLGDRVAEGVREARGAGGIAEPVERGARKRRPKDEGLLRVGRDRPARRMTVDEAREQVGERRDPAAEERRAPRKELALGPLDVRAVRHDEDRILVEDGQVP